MGDQLVEEFPADEGVHIAHALAEQIVLDRPQYLAKAHIVGLSMGGFATLHFGLTYPDRALSLLVAGAGYGAEKAFEEYFRDVSLEVAQQFEAQGAEQFSQVYGMAASRISYLTKDPRGWVEFRQQLGEHDSLGSAMTMRGVQARRP